jgi:hypothetical protein
MKSWWLLLAILAGMLLLASNVHASSSLFHEARRFLNLGSTFGSPTSCSKETPYDRVMGHPVFQVTTPWGAPYMNFEKVDAVERQSLQLSQGGDIMGPESESRPVTLFYMDPDDAIQMHEEMKQMSNMGNADIRITVTTLAKAIRQSSNLGGGLVTGSPIEALDGKLKSTNEGGSLRYKIVPPKRQLFYAASCQGKERVGLFGNAQEEANTFVESSQFVHNVNLERRREKKERRSNTSGLSRAQLESAHMEGYSGIPVFYAPQLKRVHPLWKMSREEMPFFFSYEDLQEAWKTMRRRHKKQRNIPAQPSVVEVFNLMDVLTSMEREQWKKKRKGFHWKDFSVGSLKMNRDKNDGLGLESITFVPPSYCVSYKEKISAQGNGKARLRPMR